MREDDRQREAREALDRVGRESETLGSSALARMGQRVGDHFAARDAAGEVDGAPDPIEVWGRRIGRGLSLIGVVALTYWLGLQLHWW